jgi:GNAT superfamily N-acetyltransferase
MTSLAAGYAVRPPTHADIAAGQRLLDDIETAECGEPRRHDNRLDVDFADPRIDLEHDAWLVTAPPGGAAPLAGLAYLWRPRPTGEILADHYVHPGHVGRGVSDALLDRLEACAGGLAVAMPSYPPPALLLWATPGGESHDRLVARGFVAVRQTYEMRIDLTAQPPAPTWPVGIDARPLRRDRDEPAVHAADHDAFGEHFLFEPKPIEEWRRRFVDRPGMDPDLWVIAWDGDEVAGYASGSAADDGGMVDGLAVRKPWRHRGLGQALLTAQFRTFVARGVTPVRLFVDAQNATGAVALYERVGMRVERRFDVLRKPVA